MANQKLLISLKLLEIANTFSFSPTSAQLTVVRMCVALLTNAGLGVCPIRPDSDMQ